MVPRRNSALEGVVSEGPPIIEDVVPTPIFSGNTQFKAPNAISFASAATKLATPMVHGTLMADFAAEPQALRDCSDVFPAKTFVDLVITVCTSTLQPVSLFHSSTHSGRVSKRSGRPL